MLRGKDSLAVLTATSRTEDLLHFLDLSGADAECFSAAHALCFDLAVLSHLAGLFECLDHRVDAARLWRWGLDGIGDFNRLLLGLFANHSFESGDPEPFRKRDAEAADALFAQLPNGYRVARGEDREDGGGAVSVAEDGHKR